ncbi:MAG TPA: GNAT family N-acetyltransferase [Bacteroidia bacterium]|nr:GNAT family N-acetyltransferase [Bacteroidia bacterium]
MKNSTMETERLSLSLLTLDETDFMFELLNTPEWIRFIGERNIRTKADAAAYIQKIADNPTADYWGVKLKDTATPIGVVTFMKRDYLDHYDIGYAFLPQYGKKGYAHEASKRLFDEIKNDHSTILATVLKENNNSIQLLEKLGLRFDKEIIFNNEPLQLYRIALRK